MAQSANYSPDYSYDDNRAHALALHDLLTGSLVRALANVMNEAREAAPADYVARMEGLYRRPDREREAGRGLSLALTAVFPSTPANPSTPKRKPPSKMTKAERATHDARQAMRRAALEELKADSMRVLVEREARKAKGKPST